MGYTSHMPVVLLVNRVTQGDFDVSLSAMTIPTLTLSYRLYAFQTTGNATTSR